MDGAGTTHLFADECKKGGCCIVAAVIRVGDLASTRRQMRALLLPNQRRIHFKDENTSRKKQILDAIETTGVTALVYVGPDGVRELTARRACLSRLVSDAADLRATRLVIERDDSLLDHDRQCLYQATRASDAIEYHHLRAHEECLLWIADAVAWCWAAKAFWRDRVQSMIGVIYL